mmetsp:Transcript_11846/g.23323  ORF Transcript_11846/g.23323 Transcript_11846/m.23323 type:complete len:279 (-) Transcript_11846:863-1699(-)
MPYFLSCPHRKKRCGARIDRLRWFWRHFHLARRADRRSPSHWHCIHWPSQPADLDGQCDALPVPRQALTRGHRRRVGRVACTRPERIHLLDDHHTACPECKSHARHVLIGRSLKHCWDGSRLGTSFLLSLCLGSRLGEPARRRHDSCPHARPRRLSTRSNRPKPSKQYRRVPPGQPSRCDRGKTSIGRIGCRDPDQPRHVPAYGGLFPCQRILHPRGCRSDDNRVQPAFLLVVRVEGYDLCLAQLYHRCRSCFAQVHLSVSVWCCSRLGFSVRESPCR